MFNKKVATILFTLCASSMAQAHVIQLNSYFNGGPFDREVHLRNPVLYAANPGRYKIDFLRTGETVEGQTVGYTAWNGWRNVLGCDAQGSVCQNGWLTYFRYDRGGDSTINDTKLLGDATSWATSELAFQAAKARGSQFIDVTAPTTLRFYIADNWHYDNVGGVAFQITQVAAVPEPETYAMMLAGLAGIGLLARRKKKEQPLA